MASYEIEIKSLLGTKESADQLKERLKAHNFPLSFVSKNKQLNHYFIKGSIERLAEKLLPHLSRDTHGQFIKIIEDGEGHSIRTRQLDDLIIFVVKASIDDATSSNSVSRMEFEAVVDFTLDDLDQLLLATGYEYQAKWSREREEYDIGDIHVCIDKNAGYGYVVEFEKVISEESQVEDVKNTLHALMNDLNVKELPQDRLERMFSYYNKHWRDYYGTEKVFVID